jgi:5-carboxymethyl-2-hydroxymuconate isomerase
MPHIIVEYSQDLKRAFSIAAMIEDLHNSIVGLHGVTLDRLKTRAHGTDDFFIGGQGNWTNFVHINLRLMPGRTDEQRQELSHILYNAAEKYTSISSLPVTLTVETSELHGPSYHA